MESIVPPTSDTQVETAPYFQDATVTLHHGDCIEVLRRLPDASVHAVVTDPPYGLEFMGKTWDRFDEDSRARAGMAATGYTDGAERLERPSFLGGLNPRCRSCGLWQRGGNPCRCDAPDFPNERRGRSAAFGDWCLDWTAECLRVLKPGGHLLAFGGTRTWHRLAAAVEDTGFEVRDSIAWMYGSGFPKSLDVSKAIDKAAGAEREVTGIGKAGASSMSNRSRVEHGYRPTVLDGSSFDITAPATDSARAWQGWGTALKPAFEPIVVARKPLAGTVATNVLQHGSGALNIDGCRIEGDVPATTRGANQFGSINDDGWQPSQTGARIEPHAAGRWPANVVLDESQAAVLDEQSGESQSRIGKPRGADSGDGWGMTATGSEYDDLGGASRFFYVAKADSTERPRVGGTAHPTVKPLDLMRWLVRLVTPIGGTILEPFAGSGTTVEACILEGFKCVAIERESDYLPLIEARIARRRDPVRALELTRTKDAEPDLFGGVA